MPAPRCVPLSPTLAGDYLDFFDRRAFTDNPRWAGCYCYYPLHDPARSAWSRRTGAENRAAIVESIARGEARGHLAYRGDEVVGWCSAGPWSQYPMLADEAPPDAATVGVIFCFVVAPGARGQGVATALLEAACEGLRAQGMRVAQAKPVRGAEGAAANHLGPLAMYLRAGFTVWRETPGGDVHVRRWLAPEAPGAAGDAGRPA